MGSKNQWTDKSAIMRDLSFAQGRWVPGGIESAVAVAGGKPPAHYSKEETEEEYFKKWTAGDGDFSTGPELSIITKMLEMVHGEEPETDYPQHEPVEIKKLNPVAAPFVPRFKKNGTKQISENLQVKPVTGNAKQNKKPRRQRNVAIASIIANAMNISEDVKDVSIKLAKPEDFIKAGNAKPKKIDLEEINAINKQKDSVNKVNSWLQTQDIGSMFRKKSSTKSVNEASDTLIAESLKSPGQSDGSVKSPQKAGKHFVPSSWATEYYKKCLDRTHIRDMVQENVWAKAEKIMKDIDIRKAEEQRKQEEADAALAAAIAAAEEQALKNETENRGDTEQEDGTGKCDEPPASDPKGIAAVLLPEHRHLLTGDGNCIVCKVLSKASSDKELLFETEADTEGQTSQTEVEHKADEELSIEQANESPEEQLFCLVRSSFVENLADLEEEFRHLQLEESGSTEVFEILTPDS